jgi:hypothetical protein
MGFGKRFEQHIFKGQRLGSQAKVFQIPILLKILSHYSALKTTQNKIKWFGL